MVKIKQNKKAIKKYLKVFERATEEQKYSNLFFIKGALYFTLNQEEDARDYFVKSQKDILEILVFLHNENREKVVPNEIFFSVLDNDNFFNKTIEKDKDKSEDYKMAYIYSILIIIQLHINNENEKEVATYTSKTAAQSMLFEKSNFKLNAINYSNDPTEGKTLLDFFFKKDDCPTKEILNKDYSAFAGCFTFNHDRLNQFRLYGKEDGKEGTGLSLVFHNSFFKADAKMAIIGIKRDEKNEGEKHALFRCIYIDPETQRIESVGQKEEYLFYREGKENNKTNDKIKLEIENYRDYISKLTKNIEKQMNELKDFVKKTNLDLEIVGQLLINLRYLTKHIAFQEEQECRIVKIHSLAESKIKTSNDYKQMYVEYLKIPNYVDKIYFGPKATGTELFQDILTHKGILVKCIQSQNPLA
ncbi:MAG: DUF2971 domain-containing protein [Candidatus Azobacteroides sp.]|nr:DUF2971 domain-containing protein [Candidatus Azobacteroides sp.]